MQLSAINVIYTILTLFEQYNFPTHTHAHTHARTHREREREREREKKKIYIYREIDR